MSLRPESLIFIDTQLVWMTCGVEAGYQLLMAPPAIGTAWTDLLEQAFPSFELGGEQLRTAQVAYEGGRALAVAFVDPGYHDASSRPIKHFMLWLDVDETAFQKVQQLAIPQLLQQLEPAFEVLRRASRYASEQEICKAAQAKQSERRLRLSFSAKNPAPKNKNQAPKNTVKIAAPENLDDNQEALNMPQWLLLLIVLLVVSALAAAVWITAST